jgi:putative glutamine amidotransferase
MKEMDIMTKQSKPVIGISGSVADFKGIPSVYLHQKYVQSVKDAGGIPLVLPIGTEEMTEMWVSKCDGIILSGGIDVDPHSYNKDPDPELGKVNEDRDKTEKWLVKYALKQKKTIFAICRGLAMLNAALGGTVIQDIKKNDENAIKHYQKAARPDPTHNMTIEENSRLAEIIGSTNIRVNSMHHQAIGEVASSLKAVAHAPDGVIEGLEGVKDDPLIFGVQWHPEEMAAEDEYHFNLFKYFVEVCEKKLVGSTS